ncbi:MAG: hypothetical protein ACYSR1_04875 [Planctomycetota bacterium]|jgi:hypothetical protein
MLILGINSVTNEYQSMIQTVKMMKSRIARAKEGKFTVGKPPFGRRRDKEGYLEIIEEDKELSPRGLKAEHVTRNGKQGYLLSLCEST